jgi:hypothetical protein
VDSLVAVRALHAFDNRSPRRQVAPPFKHAISQQCGIGKRNLARNETNMGIKGPMLFTRNRIMLRSHVFALNTCILSHRRNLLRTPCARTVACPPGR